MLMFYHVLIVLSLHIVDRSGLRASPTCLNCKLCCVLCPMQAGEASQVETVSEENKGLIWTLLKQLRPGMDLSKVVLPTFILEKRSLLEMEGKEDAQKVLKCMYCGHSFESLQDLSVHMIKTKHYQKVPLKLNSVIAQ